MTRAFVLAAVLLLAHGVDTVYAQAGPAAAAQLRLRQGLDAGTYRAVTLVFDSAQARGLPVEPLVNRALQATLHRTPGPRVRDAVTKLADRLAVARAAMGDASSEAELAAGANALAVGVTPATLAEIRALSQGRPITVPLGMLTQLVAQKVKPGHASEMVVALLRRGATSAQLVSLSDDVTRDAGAGIAADAALDVRARGVIGTLERGALTDAAAPTELFRGGSTGARTGSSSSPTRVPRKP